MGIVGPDHETKHDQVVADWYLGVQNKSPCTFWPTKAEVLAQTWFVTIHLPGRSEQEREYASGAFSGRTRRRSGAISIAVEC